MEETIPVATAVLTCNAVKPNGSAVDIERVFSHFDENTFPTRLPCFAIYVQLTGGFGTHKIRLEIRNPSDRDALLWHDERMECSLRDAWEVRHGYVWVRDLLIPHAGKFDIAVLCGGKKIGQQQILVGFSIPAL